MGIGPVGRRLLAFGAAVVLAFGLGAVAGATLGPDADRGGPERAPTHQHGEHRHGGHQR